jgi:hypothetical protein
MDEGALRHACFAAMHALQPAGELHWSASLTGSQRFM